MNSDQSVTASVGPRVPGHRLGRQARIILDAAIAAYALVALGALVFGGFTLGPLSATHAAKPALLLILLVPLRFAIGGETWLSTAVVGTASRLYYAIRLSQAVKDVIFAIVVTRVATFAIAFIANILLVPHAARPFAVSLPWQELSETFAIWDSGWYFDIAARGYYYRADGQSSIAFFPLYPLLVRVCALPFGGSDGAIWVAAIAVSWMSFFLALIALHKLAERLTGSAEAARRAVILTAVFPFSIYFTRVYTESLFLLVTILSIRSAVDSRWWAAGLFGGLATLTRPNGILILLPLGLMALSARPSGLTLARKLVALAPIPLAIAGYSAYVYTLSGDPLAWLAAQRHWGYSLDRWPHTHLLSGLSALEQEGIYGWLLRYETAPFDAAYVGVALVFLALVPLIVRKLGAALAIYVLVSLLIPLSGSALVGIGRYASVLFPAFIVLGTLGSSRFFEALLIISAMFRTLFLALLIAWYPLH